MFRLRCNKKSARIYAGEERCVGLSFFRSRDRHAPCLDAGRAPGPFSVLVAGSLFPDPSIDPDVAFDFALDREAGSCRVVCFESWRGPFGKANAKHRALTIKCFRVGRFRCLSMTFRHRGRCSPSRSSFSARRSNGCMRSAFHNLTWIFSPTQKILHAQPRIRPTRIQARDRGHEAKRTESRSVMPVALPYEGTCATVMRFDIPMNIRR